MPKWKLFGKSKSKDEETEEPIEPTDEEEKEEEKETEQEVEEEPVEYRDTLYSGTSTSKQESTYSTSEQRHWRDLESIEKNIDNLHITKARKPHTDVEKSVDTLILEKEEK